MLTLNTRSVEKEEDDATRAPESGDKQPERDKELFRCYSCCGIMDIWPLRSRIANLIAFSS